MKQKHTPWWTQKRPIPPAPRPGSMQDRQQNYIASLIDDWAQARLRHGDTSVADRAVEYGKRLLDPPRCACGRSSHKGDL